MRQCSATSLKALVLLLVLGLMFSHVTCQEFIPEINSFDPPTPSDNRRGLVCRVQTGTGFEVPVLNTEFYLNGSDVRNELPGSAFQELTGKIIFDMTPELEGCYTCGNGTYRSSEEEALKLVFYPTADPDINLYYTVSVGASAVLQCGVSQGALGDLYSPRWTYGRFQIVNPNTPGSRFKLKRAFNEDFSLIVSFVILEDNGTYLCEVGVNGMHLVESPPIELLVYEQPTILYMTEDQILVVPPNTSDPITQQFTCNATGAPNLKIVWKHKDRLIRRSNEKYSIKTDNVTPNSPLMTLHSVLSIRNPAIIDSGPVSCEARIRYRKDSANVNSSISIIENVTSSLIVLDTSLEPRPFLTQASDLLVRIDLSEDVEISEAIRVRVRLTPETDEQPVEFTIDGEFVGVTMLYPFIPMSSIPATFRRFHTQVSLLVDNVQGPFNPPQPSTRQFIDLDLNNDCESHLHIIILATVGAALLTAVIITVFTVVCCKKIKDKQLENKRDLQTQVANDKTVEQFTKLLDTMYSQVDKVPEEMVDLFKDKIDRYSAVIDDIAKANASALKDVHAKGAVKPDDGGTINEGSGAGAEHMYMTEKQKTKARIEQLKRRVNELCSNTQ